VKRGVLVERDQPERGHGHAGGGQALPHLVLVAGRADGVHRVRRQRQPLGDGRADDGREVVDPDDGVDRMRAIEGGDLLGGGLGVGEVEGDQVVGDVRLEGARPLGGAHEVDAELARRLDERLGAVGGRRQEQEQPVHRGSARSPGGDPRG
jgi:hypothetical protein